MAGRYEGPPGHEEPAEANPSQRPGQPGGPGGPGTPGASGAPGGTRILRAAFVLVVVIVLAVLLLPSGTRGPRAVTSSTSTTIKMTTHPTTTTTQPVTTTTLPAIPHSEIKVLVANGTTTAHGASEVRTWLGSHGFDVAPFPAYDTTTLQSADAIYVVNSGTTTMADEVASALTLGPSVIQPAGATAPVSTDAGADVVVVLGTDLATRADAGTLGQPPAGSSSTTSTSSTTTSTTS